MLYKYILTFNGSFQEISVELQRQSENVFCFEIMHVLCILWLHKPLMNTLYIRTYLNEQNENGYLIKNRLCCGFIVYLHSRLWFNIANSPIIRIYRSYSAYIQCTRLNRSRSCYILQYWDSYQFSMEGERKS